MPTKMFSRINSILKKHSQLFFSFTISFVFFITTLPSNNYFAGEITFEKQTLDNTNPGRSEIADIDGDGFKDVLLHTWATNNGLNNDGSLAWYKYPNWERNVIKANTNFFGDAIVGNDLDSDGDIDVITSKGNYNAAEVWWYKNPGAPTTGTWTEYQIGVINDVSEVKDIAVIDMNNDNNPDVIVRTKNKVVIYFYIDGISWNQRELSIREREGMTIADLNSDGNPDIILNGFWLKHPGDAQNGTWQEYTIDPQWYSDVTGGWQDFSVMVTTGDFDADGKTDVVFSHSEKTGFNVTLYKNVNPLNGASGWTKIPIQIVDYCHTLQAVDIDMDGDLDIVAGTLKRTSTPKLMALLNEGSGIFWSSSIIDGSSTYKAKVGDIDNDGDYDISSARSWEDAPLQVWMNNSQPSLSLNSWEKFLIDPGFEYNAMALLFSDLNGDGLSDIITGGWWYKNPGSASGTWIKNTLPAPLKNAAIAEDFDGDGDIDLFGSQNAGTGINNALAWGENSGNGNFTVRSNISTAGSGDFLQGQSYGNFGSGKEILLSWHNGGGGLQSVSIPSPITNQWTSSIASATTLKEAISKGDIDGDGDIDLLLGTTWMQNNSGSWTPKTIGIVNDLNPLAEPDRNKLVDINNDGRLDAVIGLENGTQIIWFEAPVDPTQTWTRHIIGNVDGQGFSLDAADFDDDGDIDVVVGEHRGSITNSVIIFENLASGSGWNERVIDTDSKNIIDHHIGTQAFDIDNDGDLDIVSIGWYNKKLWIYENKAISEASPSILIQPANAGIIEGQTAQFSVTASGTQPINYQWFRNNQSIPGANSASYQINYALFSMTGDEFKCIVNNSFGSIESDPATLHVTKPDRRVTHSQVALYNFRENGGNLIYDQSGVGEAQNLLINNTSAVVWNENSLQVTSPTKIISENAAVKIIDSIKTTNELTLEAWIKTSSLSQNGPARIVTLSADALERNFTMGQGVPNGSSDQIDFRLRTTFTTPNGTPSVSSGQGTIADNLQHVAVTFDKNGYTIIYIDGVQKSAQQIGGALSNWAENYKFGLANEILEERPWLGELFLVAVYYRSLSPNEIAHNHQLGVTELVDPNFIWGGNINLSDAGGLKSANYLQFGLHNLATDGLDQNLGETQLPPIPAAGIFDVRFNLPANIGSLVDLRNSNLTSADFYLKFQPGSSGYPVTLNWDLTSLPEGSLVIKDVQTGSLINADMKTQNSLVITDPQIKELKIEYRESTTLNVGYNDSWNLISVPLLSSDMSFTSLFSNSSSAFKFNSSSGYIQSDTASNGEGYWLKFSGNQSILFEGIKINEPVQVNAGWNIIGPFDQPININQISTTPTGIITSDFFGYSGGYTSASSLQPGMAYWIKVTQNGELNFSGILNKNVENYAEANPSAAIVITDNSGKKSSLMIFDKDSNLDRYELPPLPPTGVFDARFTTGKNAVSLESENVRVSVKGAAYPIRIKADGVSLQIKDVIDGSILNESIADGEEIMINNNSLNIFNVKIGAINQIPTVFELSQNYPNPFNPTTKIKFSISTSPQTAEVVILKIYDTLGQEVTTLLNEPLQPGFHEVEFNASQLPSGVYFYSLKAGEYYSVKKMILIK